MHSSKSENWPSLHLYLKINTDCHSLENSSEEAISENSQLMELHKIINTV